MDRPELSDKISIDDFTSFYWLKKELTVFCKIKGINTTGSKIEITERIKGFLTTGQKTIQAKNETPKTASTFDWSTSVLSLDTVLTDNYKSTENVRAFLKSQIGNHFRFTIDFMKWAEQNTGKTLGDAITKWNGLYNLKKDKNYKTKIAPQFEYNRYMRAFLADNPDKTMKDAIRFWKLKRGLRGDNEYAESDLLLDPING
ncbi:cytoplasmic protein [bacterium]|nr:MAG: cytoplasmic protein [bacterium]